MISSITLNPSFFGVYKEDFKRIFGMSGQLRQILLKTYNNPQKELLSETSEHRYIQIDDQDDHDNITEFCNIFVNFKKRNTFELEISGRIPISDEMADLIEIYQGKVDPNRNKITLTLNLHQIEVLTDFASLISKSSHLGSVVGNSNWKQNSERTINSLSRFVHLIKEYLLNKHSMLA
jgi:hypothetical protein